MAAVPHWLAVLWTVIWAAAGAALAHRLASPWRFTVVGLAGVAVLVAVDYGTFLQGWWVPLVPPLAGWLASSTLVTAYTSYRQAAERGSGHRQALVLEEDCELEEEGEQHRRAHVAGAG